ADARYQRMFTPEKNGYAYGWSVRTKSGRKSISHSGGINGFVSHILRYPEEKLCVVVLSNSLPASPARVARDLAAIVLGERYELPRAREGSLEATLDELVKNGSLVAAQAVVGRGDRILIDHAVGVTNPGGDRKVNAETLFCIGSCSKPFVSAVVMSLVEDGLLELEQPICKYVPAFDNLKLPNGQQSERAPTMKELLAHRGGIYSQKKGMTPRQAGWIRNFGLTLEESVQGIVSEPLISRPGSEYAYSGAGYCVAGRVAEVASGKPFEQLLQSRIAAPLKLKRTTYFPAANDGNVAAGGGEKMADLKTPHLTEPELRFALIGGSLYSTAQETARFLRMVAQHGKIGNNEVMKRDSWRIWTSRPYAEGSYGFGWSLTARPPTAQPFSLTHSGSLASSRSAMVVDLNTGVYSVVHYTVAGRDPAVVEKIKSAIAAMSNRLR
ncbi:MAG: serine hydrolase, partial [Pirellulaceae bacterium]|nr:serine hydrolase [Pirellulaceae bacterium]